MTKKFLLGVAVMLAAGCSAGGGSDDAVRVGLDQGKNVPRGVYGTGRYVVVFRSDTLPADAADRVSRAGGRTLLAVGQIGLLTAQGDGAFAGRIARDPSVLAVGPEHSYALPQTRVIESPEAAEVEGAPLPADNLYGYQWDM